MRYFMFTLYSKVNCKYCESIEKIFKIKEVLYEKKMLNVDFTRDEFIERFGQSTFPRVLRDGVLVGGTTEALMLLKKEGVL